MVACVLDDDADLLRRGIELVCVPYSWCRRPAYRAAPRARRHPRPGPGTRRRSGRPTGCRRHPRRREPIAGFEAVGKLEPHMTARAALCGGRSRRCCSLTASRARFSQTLVPEARLVGVLTWPAVALHAALAVWCIACLRPEDNDRRRPGVIELLMTSLP